MCSRECHLQFAQIRLHTVPPSKAIQTFIAFFTGNQTFSEVECFSLAPAEFCMESFSSGQLFRQLRFSECVGEGQESGGKLLGDLHYFYSPWRTAKCVNAASCLKFVILDSKVFCAVFCSSHCKIPDFIGVSRFWYNCCQFLPFCREVAEVCPLGYKVAAEHWYLLLCSPL